ncbi:hypothetical protein SNEBB_008431 [Seison nebaliae]|nr:hypothetical protein SNEBB_008431 [Seison nebaliae]
MNKNKSNLLENSKNYRSIPFNHPLPTGGKVAGHVLFWCGTKQKTFNVYENRAKILMQLRFDGTLGFTGGFIDEKELVIDGVNRECKEEINLKEELFVEKKDHFESEEDMRELVEKSMKAKDFGTEVCGLIFPPIYTMRNEVGGLPTFLQHKFVGCTRNQLLRTLRYLELISEENYMKFILI